MSNKKTNKRQATQSDAANAAVIAVPVANVNTTASREIYRELGKFSFDVAKLVIGGVILSGLMKQDIDYYTLAGWGAIVITILILIGVGLMKYSSSKSK